MSSEYQGESRLELKVKVENGRSSTNDALGPALGFGMADAIHFKHLRVRGEFPAGFRIDLYAAPQNSLFVPIDPQLAPGLEMAIQFLAAVPKVRDDLVVSLIRDPGPESKVCWNGSCDVLPGHEITRCDNAECAVTRTRCVGDVCDGEEVPDEQIEVTMERALPAELPANLKEIVGFADEYVVLYLRDGLPAQSWAALRLGAPDGLDAGYHLAALHEPDEQALHAASKCAGKAREAALDAYNAPRDAPLDLKNMRCFFGEERSCDFRSLPKGEDAKELTERVAEAEADARCSLLAVDLAPVDAEAETITVRIGDAAPDWFAWRSSTPSNVETEEP